MVIDEWLEYFKTYTELSKYQKNMTWFKPETTIMSRINSWFVSDKMPSLESTSKTSAAPLTDQCMNKLCLK